MPRVRRVRGNGRQAPLGRRGQRNRGQAQRQPHEQDEALQHPRDQRGEERVADDGREQPIDVLDGDMVDERVQQSDAGRSNILDFEQIIRESQIIPANNQTNACNSIEGCGDKNNNVGLIESNLGLNRFDMCQSNAHAFNTSDIIPPNHLPSVRLASDDLGAHVPATLKQKICRGEFINLALMLKGAGELAEFCRGSVFKLGDDGHIVSTQKACKDQINCIEKWTNAFLIYASIFLSTHPDKVYDLLHYMYNIRDCAARLGGLAWRSYDEQFRIRQAISPSPWCNINTDLWWRCVLVRPVLRNQSNPYRYTCDDFNAGKCTWPNCRFSHRCAKCSGPHPELNCQNSQSQPSATSTQTPSPGRTNFRGRGSRPFFRPRGRWQWSAKRQ